MDISFEKDALVITIGAMGTGKSTFLEAHLPKHLIVSTDGIREQLCGDFNSQSVNDPTFEILYATLEARAKAGIFTAVDSTGTQSVIERVKKIAEQFKRPVYALTFPELTEEELTPERMKHRMKVIHIYHNQVNRVKNKTYIPKNFIVHEIPKQDRHTIKVTVGSTNTIGLNTLDPQYHYMVIPDLHGEYWVFAKVREMLDADPMLRIIQLGDINDRGESSFKTFNNVYDLWEQGKLFAVPGNHDNKFYRWVKKFMTSSVPAYIGNYPSLGMKISHGLDKTLEEFMALPREKRDLFAAQVVEMHDALPAYLKLDRDEAGVKTRHYFSHAGFTAALAMGMEPNGADWSQVLYGSIYSPERVKAILEPVLGQAIAAGDINFVCLNVGHTYGHVDHITKATLQVEGPYGLFSHDIGLGKREDIREQPHFVIL